MNISELYELYLQSSGISTDTRKINQDSIFFALTGHNFNGNEFAIQALERGASFAVVDQELNTKSNKIIYVENVLSTLQQLATFHRRQLKTPIIALTGSNGKTTTKELINAVLSTKYKTLATRGNLNNHIGVPLTLLEIKKETEIAIVEMGANHQKEIENLCNIAEPDFGLITNFGKAHLEGFGGVEGVIKGKSEMYDYLTQHNKVIFVNENDPIQMQKTAGYSQLKLFGSKSQTGVSLKLLDSQPYVSLKYEGSTINSQLAGSYNFNNIAIAVAIGNFFKIEKEAIIMSIEDYSPTNNRSQILEKNNNKILMDAYNANPTSMMAALENFRLLEHPHKILILGDMFELGLDAAFEHQSIVDYIAKNPFENVYLVGKNFFNTTSKANYIQQFKEFDELKNTIKNQHFKNKFILIKGSRGMALERIMDLL